MDPSLILPYLWVLLVLVFLEGLLAADNAIVMAVMVKHLPPEQRKKALFYGLLGAFIFRFIALFLVYCELLVDSSCRCNLFNLYVYQEFVGFLP